MKKGSNNKKSKMPLIIGLGTGVMVLGGLGYWFFVKRKSSDTEEVLPDTEQVINNQTPNSPIPSGADPTQEVYSIKKGSKGAIVKELQEALIKKYGKNILPKYGADGQFGSEMEKALMSIGRPVMYSERKANYLIKELLEESAKENTTQSTNSNNLSMENKEAIDIAKNLWLFLTTNKFNETITTLKRIKDVEQYKKVNELFKTIRLNGVKQTIVNGTLSAFSDGTSKQLIRTEFMRMGLKYDGEKWTLEGFSKKRKNGFYRKNIYKSHPHSLSFFRK